ncbi:hypothetical protein Hanom_Chr10g00899871 [Helianthus anomalus]
MKEAGYEQRKRGKKATPKVQKGEGSSSQPKKCQKKVAKTLLIDESDVEEPVPEAEVEVEPDVEGLLLLKKLKAFNAKKDKAVVDAQKEKAADDVEGDDVNKSTTSSSSSSEDEINETKRLKRIQEETAK